MTDSRETGSWDAIRRSVLPPAATTVPPVGKPAPVEAESVRLAADAAPSGQTPPSGKIASTPVGLHGTTEKAVKAEINAKAAEFQGLAEANKHLNKGQTADTTSGQPSGISATVTVTRRGRNGKTHTEQRTVGWLAQYEQLPTTAKKNCFAGQSHSNDRSYGRNVNEVVGIADSILQELQFLQDAKGLNGSTYRSLADAVAVAKASPNNRQAMLSLYGEMITFVQIVRQSGVSTLQYPQFLQDNYDAFSASAAESGGADALVRTILRDLKVADVASLQREKLGMTGAAVTGKFDAATYFATQLYVMEQMARNLSRRDGLGMAVMEQSVKDAKASVDRMVDLRTNFADRVHQNNVSAATLKFLTSQGYKLEGGTLKGADGAAIADAMLGDLSAKWLEQATYMAQQSHKDVQDAMSLHGTYLTKNQRKQVEGWVNAYELFYKDTMTRGSAPSARTLNLTPTPTGYHKPPGTGELGQAPEQPDVTDAMAVATLERVAEKEEKQPAPDPGKVDDPGEAGARLARGAKVAQEMSQFYARLKDGLDIGTLNGEERRTVATLERYGYIRREGTKVFLTASDDQLQEFGKMAETFARPESPAAAAILNTVITGFVRVHMLAALKEDILGIATLSSPCGTCLDPQAPATGPDGAEGAADPSATADDDDTVDHPGGHGDTPVEPARKQAPTVTPTAPSAKEPQRITLLTDWSDEVHAQREDREKRAEKKRQVAIAEDQAYSDAVQAKGAKVAHERREEILSTDTRVVRGSDGKAVGVVTGGDGQVIGTAPAVDPGTVSETPKRD